MTVDQFSKISPLGSMSKLTRKRTGVREILSILRNLVRRSRRRADLDRATPSAGVVGWRLRQSTSAGDGPSSFPAVKVRRDPPPPREARPFESEGQVW